MPHCGGIPQMLSLVLHSKNNFTCWQWHNVKHKVNHELIICRPQGDNGCIDDKVTAPLCTEAPNLLLEGETQAVPNEQYS
jgi:hypothetical protein